MRFAIAGFSFAIMSASIAHGQFQQVDLSPFYNADKRTLCCGANEFPAGNVTYFGVPFYLGPSSGNNMVYLNDTNPVTVTIPLFGASAQRVRTIINTLWGQPGPNSYLRIEFVGVDQSVYAINLIGGVHIRDYGPAFTQTFEQNPPTCTRNVFIASTNNSKFDMQTFALPASIRQSGLESIRLIDTGAVNFQRAMLQAITLDTRICEANINDDCQVDFFDYLDFVQRLSTNDPEADFNGDGAIDFFDYLDFVQAFSQGC